jgi:hypothetical protein
MRGRCWSNSRPAAVRAARHEGQVALEFALVLPLLLLAVLGLVAAAWLLFNYEAVVSGARSGVRAAIVQTSLLTLTAQGWCASGNPTPIPQAVQRGATVIPVNQAPLCRAPGNPQELVQTAPDPGTATVTVTCLPALAPAACREVTVTVTRSLVPPFPFAGPVTLTASSTLPAQ